jgi:hypothetical protein
MQILGLVPPTPLFLQDLHAHFRDFTSERESTLAKRCTVGTKQITIVHGDKIPLPQLFI